MTDVELSPLGLREILTVAYTCLKPACTFFAFRHDMGLLLATSVLLIDEGGGCGSWSRLF